MLSELRPARGSRKASKRVGRGPGSGHGKTSCRGQKGAGARAGGGKGPGFEGGQMPLQRRLPKKGFYHEREVEYVILNLKRLSVFGKDAEVSPQTLLEKGLLKKAGARVKVLAEGSVEVPLHVKVHSISQAARRKVEEAGGKVEVLA